MALGWLFFYVCCPCVFISIDLRLYIYRSTLVYL
nr:MAG TPA: hypothetical protein [Caudoviricetes sp.]